MGFAIFRRAARCSVAQGLSLAIAGRQVSAPRAVAVILAAALLLAGAPAGAAEVDVRLLAAAKAGDEAAVRVALADGADVTAPEKDGTTPLHWAVHADAPAIVELLLAAGAKDDAATDKDDEKK